jgi:hypothetical protein
MSALKTIDELAPDTIHNYRSRLRRLFLSLDMLTGDEAVAVKRKIARLEAQIGVNAETIGGPGRPRRSNALGQSATSFAANTNK